MRRNGQIVRSSASCGQSSNFIDKIVKLRFCSQLELRRCETIIQRANCSPESYASDDVFFLQAALERGGYGEERYEKLDFQKVVASKYEQLQDSTWEVSGQILVHNS